MDSVSTSFGGCFSLIGTMAQSAFAARQMIEALDDAGEEFHDILQQLIFISETLGDLERLLRNSSVPPSLAEDYESRLQIFRTRLGEIETALKHVFENMYSKSFFRRRNRKSNTVDVDIRRLTSKLLAFNQSLQSLMTTFICQLSCTLISLVNDDASGVRPRSSSRSLRADIKSQYIRGEGWEGAYSVGDLSEERPRGPSMDPKVDISSHYAKEALRSQNEDWDKAFEVEAGNSWGTRHELAAEDSWETRHELEGDTAWGGRHELDSSNYLETSPTGLLKDGEIQSAKHKLTLQGQYAADAKRFQDEEWMEWAQARQNPSGAW